jgi:hypothetical protein
MVTAMLAFQALWVFGDNAVSPPNPIGEKLYYAHFRAHLFSELLPVAIIVCALLLGCLLHLAQRKAKNLAPEWSYEI